MVGDSRSWISMATESTRSSSVGCPVARRESELTTRSETLADRLGQQRLVAACERQRRAILQHELVVAVKHGAKLRDESHADDVRAMDTQEFARVELRDEARQ